MEVVDYQEITALRLHVSSTAQDHRAVCYCHMACKVLYAAGERRLTPQEVGQEIANALKLASVRSGELDAGLRLASTENLAEQNSGRWTLTGEGQRLVADCLTQNRERTRSIIDRHFHTIPNPDRIKDWFQDTCCDYFGQYGTAWVTAMSNGKTARGSHISLDDLIERTVKKHGLHSELSVLRNGFVAFIASRQFKDREHMWELAQSMFAARLLASSLGADPLTRRQLADSVVLLDTNILISLAIDSRQQPEAFAALGRVLKSLNAQLRFVPTTEDEYRRVVTRYRNSMIHIVETLGDGALESIKGAADDFSVAVIARGCQSLEDVERFFDAIIDPPRNWGEDLEIARLDDEGIRTALEEDAQDPHLSAAIADVSRQSRPYEKPADSVNHDVSLFNAVEYLRRQGQSAWVLTLDKTMHYLAAERSVSHEIATWLRLDTLMSLLALDAGGESFAAQEFAPLLGLMLKQDLSPSHEAFQLIDLEWLVEIEDEARALSPDERTDLARLIAKARMAGRGPGDPTLRLSIHRAVQGYKNASARQSTRDAADIQAANEQRQNAEDKLSQALDREAKMLAERDEGRQTIKAQSRSLVSGGIAVALFFAGWAVIDFVDATNRLITIGVPTIFFGAALGLAINVCVGLIGNRRSD